MGAQTVTHHPDIARMLAILERTAPAPVARAEATLHHLLRDVYESPLPAFAWHASALTGDGFPLEFTFTSVDTTIRYTAQVGAPTLSAPARFDTALSVVAQLSGQTVPPEMAHALRKLQARASAGDGLEYGAWVGARHHGSTAEGDRFKLYLELPDGGAVSSLPSQLLSCPIPRLSDRRVQDRLYGYEPASGRHELYCRVPHAMTYHLYHLLCQVELEHRTHELVELIEEAYNHHLDDKIPGGSVGFSYAPGPERSIIFTLFLFARALWGGDRRILQRLTALAGAQGWDLGVYDTAAAPLRARDVYQTYHGLVGFVLAPDQPIQVTIGLRPPPVNDAP